MAKLPPIRLYTSAEVMIETTPFDPPEKMIKLRFRTNDIDGRKQSQGTTPWVAFPVIALRGLAQQLASVATTAEQWEPGLTPPSTDQAGITSKVLPPGVEPE